MLIPLWSSRRSDFSGALGLCGKVLVVVGYERSFCEKLLETSSMEAMPAGTKTDPPLGVCEN